MNVAPGSEATPLVNAPGNSSKLHPDVLKLGLVSFLTDLSSEMIFSVFAIFFTTVAGASASLLGLIEGLADFSASSLNYLAGWLSDRSGKRKSFAIAGYGFSTLAKTILLISSSILGLSLFRVIERLGKGFRGPPRDAWLSSIAGQKTRGFSFGVHKALDKSGAVLGPLVAYGLLKWLGESASTYRTVSAPTAGRAAHPTGDGAGSCRRGRRRGRSCLPCEPVRRARFRLLAGQWFVAWSASFV